MPEGKHSFCTAKTFLYLASLESDSAAWSFKCLLESARIRTFVMLVMLVMNILIMMIFYHDLHVGEYDEDDEDKVGEDEGKADNDDMVEDEDDHHKLNTPHLGNRLPDVWVNHYFFQDLQAPCFTLSICAVCLSFDFTHQFYILRHLSQVS